MNPVNRVAKNTLFLYARMAITVFISLYATRLVLAALGVSDFGVFNIVGGAVAMLTFLNGAMTRATQRFMSFAQGEGDESKQINIFNVSIILHLSIGIILVILIEISGYFLFDGILKIEPSRLDEAKLIFHFLVLSTFIKVISVPYDAVINAHENMLFVAVLGIIEALFKLGIALFITYTTRDSLVAYGLLMVVLTFFLLLIQWIYCHKKYTEVVINIREYFDKKLFKEMTSFGGWSLLGSTASLIGLYGQGIIVNIFFGTIVNASQGVANQISGQLSAFSTTMLKALNPVIAKSEGAGNRELMINASVIGSKLSFFLLSFFAIPVIVEMPYIFSIWLDEVPEFAIVFCRLIIAINLIDQMFVTLPTSIGATGKIKRFQIVVSTLALLPLVVSYVFFKMNYPPQTLYYVIIAQRIIRAFGPLLYFSKKTFDLSIGFYLKEVVLRSLLIAGVVLLFSSLPYLFLDPSFLRLILTVIVSIIISVLSLMKVGLTNKEKEQFLELFNVFSLKIKQVFLPKKYI